MAFKWKKVPIGDKWVRVNRLSNHLIMKLIELFEENRKTRKLFRKQHEQLFEIAQRRGLA